MIKKYLLYIKENHDFKEDDLIVAIDKNFGELLIGHRYYVHEILPGGQMLYVKDASTNQKYYVPANCFVSENEYLYGEETKKYNI